MSGTKFQPSLESTFRRRVLLARLAAFWERLWPALWPATGIAGAFVVGAVFGLWQALPGWLHLVVLLGFAGGLGYVLWRIRGVFRLPDVEEGVRRLERTSGVPHRPLTTLRDRPARGDAASGALWQLHQRRMAEAARRLRVTPPVAGLAGRDPFGLRAILVLLLVIGFAAAGSDGFGRLARAFEPHFGGFGAEPSGELLAWIDPPDYTGLPPIYLTNAPAAGLTAVAATEAPADVIRVPEGSELTARVHGGSNLPVLRIDAEERAFVGADRNDYEITRTLVAGTHLAVAQGGSVLGDWPIEIIPDEPPAIALAAPPEKTTRGVLKIAFEGSDDYGLVSVSATFRLVEGNADETLEIELPLAGDQPREAMEASYHDLTPHPWAGLPVEMTLSAADAIDQVATTEPEVFALPEREFSHPVARAIIEQRKRLARDPDSRAAVHRNLHTIAEQPGDYGHDLSAYLALNAALVRLFNDQRPASESGVLDLLWDVALHIEDGELTMAERELRDAQERLREALDGNASNEEIAKLTEELRQAMNRYLDLMQQQALENPPEQGPQSQPNADTRTREDLDRMLEQAEEMAQTGAREQARQMLDQLQELLENMQAMNEPGEGQEGEEAPYMDELQELSDRQEELLNDTYRGAMSRGNYEQSEPGRGETGATDQENLRRALGDLMRDVGESGMEIPDALGKAERAMRQAGKELERSHSRRAVEAQSMALDQLQKGAQQLRQAMAQNSQGQPGEGGQQGEGQVGRDPLGRLPPGDKAEDDGSVQVPQASELQRSREILKELYRRASDRDRPKTEREYIDRLLDWY